MKKLADLRNHIMDRAQNGVSTIGEALFSSFRSSINHAARMK